VLRHWSRWRLTYELLLKKAKDSLGEDDTGVTKVLGEGLGPEIDLDDLGLKKTCK